MKTPFSQQQFFEIFKEYNEAVYPLQILFYLLSFIVIYLVKKPTSKSDIIISCSLAFFWFWMGIIYHLTFFTKINKAAYIFGFLFILQGVLILIYGALQNKISFRYRANRYSIAGIILIIYALILYPLLGYALGHVYPLSPTIGLPCPTTIFTFGLLLFNDKKTPVALFLIPFVWSLIGFTAAFNFGIWEDTGLLIAGILSFTLLLIKNKMYD